MTEVGILRNNPKERGIESLNRCLDVELSCWRVKAHCFLRYQVSSNLSQLVDILPMAELQPAVAGEILAGSHYRSEFGPGTCSQ